jgi:hypothetical protein
MGQAGIKPVVDQFTRVVTAGLRVAALLLGVGLILYAVILIGCQVFYYINTGSWTKVPMSAFFMRIPHTPSNAFPNPLQLVPVFPTPLGPYLKQPSGWLWLHGIIHWTFNFVHALFLPFVLGCLLHSIAGRIPKPEADHSTKA